QNPHRPNVLMVVLESLRQDVLTPQLMPNTSTLAQDARVFDHHFSTGNATRYGLFGLLYGLPGGYWPSMLDEQRGSQLFQVLGQQGYDLHLYGSAPLYSPEFDRTAFADVRDQLHQGPSALKSDGRDRAIISALQQDIRASQAAQRPWFGFVFLDSTHAPYHMPDGYPPVATPMAADIDFLKFGPEHDPTPELNRYRTAVHYADSLIGSLLDDLRAQGLAEDTIVLVTGDHAEEFNDLKLNYWGHNGNFSDYQLQVPFVLHWPGMAAGRDARTSSHEDWVPTLMRHALGCENALSDFSTGQDLLAEPQGPRALVVESWSQRAIRHGDAIYVFDKFGNATALDRHYLPLPQQAPDAAAVRTAWEALTRFRNR
ncbi:sulfatase-like hydrolase/transferase, partial [Stenotrophomonas maltophilia]|nr:sulfatase-like hydrolase/transferase [Stenotrophomonas maltophilia]